MVYCRHCGARAPTKQVTYIRIIGMVILFQWATTRGEMCRDCISKKFWEYTLMTAFLGWWGVISFFLTIIALPVNVISFLMARSVPRVPELAGGVAPGWPGAGQAGAPPWPAAAAPGSTPAAVPAVPGWPAPVAAPGSFGAIPIAARGAPLVRRPTGTVMIVLGAVGVAFTLLMVLLGVGMIVAPTAPKYPGDPGSADAGLFLLLFFLIVAGVPSGLLLGFGLRRRSRLAASVARP